jgi:hypothetical protein
MNALTAALRLPVVLLRYRELLGAFVRRELRGAHRGLDPGPHLARRAAGAAVRDLLLHLRQDPAHPGQRPARAARRRRRRTCGWRATFFLIIGILPWTVFAESLNRGTGVVLEHANLIKKIAFPPSCCPSTRCSSTTSTS